MPAEQSIGFIGTGIMGFHMARRLAEAGCQVTAWNRTGAKALPLREFGADIAATPADAVKSADIAIVMVADGPSCDEVIFGAGGETGVLRQMGEGSTLLVMSSILVETAAAQGRAAKARKIRYLDAPVSGGESGARDGKMTIMAGGDARAFEDIQPVFSVLGRSTHVGPAGTGSLAKLANQVIVGNTIQTVAEALLLAQAGGADPNAVIEALKGGFADSPILQNHGARMIAGDFKAGGRCHTQLKDTRTALELGAALGLVLPMTAQARETYNNLVGNGQGDLDHNAAYLDLRRRSALES